MRRDDPPGSSKRYYRSDDRLFTLNGQWYFAAREGDIGPFRSRQQAASEAARFVRGQRREQPAEGAAWREALESRRAKRALYGLSLVPMEEGPRTIDFNR
jgi:hypothetical protein